MAKNTEKNALQSNKEARKKYIKENIVQVKMVLNKRTDNDVIEKLNEVDNKQGYIKNLIRKDINNKN